MGVKLRLEGAENLNKWRQDAQTILMRPKNFCCEMEQNDRVLTTAGGVKEDVRGSERPLPTGM